MSFFDEDRAYVVRGNESLWSEEQMQLSGGGFHLLVGGHQSNNAYTLLRVQDATPQIETHTHFEDDESIYMLDGRCEVQIADKTYELGPGDFIFMPKKVPHRVWATEPCTQLNIIAPGGLQDRFCEEMSDMFAAGTLNPQSIFELNIKYGIFRPESGDWFEK